MPRTVIKTTCSGCSETVSLDLVNDVAVSVVPSNGKRGSLHVGQHTVSSDLSGDDDLIMWDCPRCGHADSFDPHA